MRKLILLEDGERIEDVQDKDVVLVIDRRGEMMHPPGVPLPAESMALQVVADMMAVNDDAMEVRQDGS